MISKRSKDEFVFMFRDLFEQLQKFEWYPSQKDPMVKLIAKTAREHLGYSHTTSMVDIVHNLQKNYLQLIDKETTKT